MPYYISTQETFLITHYRAMAEAIRKEDKTLCPPKPKKARTRTDIAKAGIALYKKEQSKK